MGGLIAGFGALPALGLAPSWISRGELPWDRWSPLPLSSDIVSPYFSSSPTVGAFSLGLSPPTTGGLSALGSPGR